MGIFNQRDVYTNKWVTAEIIDSSNRLWVVPIKQQIGNHFLAKINKQMYCFTLKGARITTIYGTLVKSCKVIHYFTDNANPINPLQVKNLRELIEKNNLPKINQKLFGVLKILAQNEKQGKEFEPHLMSKLIQQIKLHEKKYPENVRTLENFISDLGIDQIGTPIQDVTEYLEEDMIAPDPTFLGNVANTLISLEEKHKIVVNEPAKNKIAWAKIIVIIMIGGLAIAGVYVLATSNLLPHLGPTANTSTSGGTSLSTNDIMKQYPDPQLLRLAIQNHQVSCQGLDKTIKDYVNTIKPSICP